MADVVLVFPLRWFGDAHQVLLGEKKTGFGVGKLVGPGGHVEPGETASQAAVRELAEETSLSASERSLQWLGRVRFRFPSCPAWDMNSEVFSVTEFTGEPTESAELKPCWYPVQRLPSERMWQDAQHWVLDLLTGPTARVTVTMAENNESVASVSRDVPD